MAQQIDQRKESSRKEEVHWSSFRDVVASLQKTLLHTIDEKHNKNMIQNPQFDFSGLERIDPNESIMCTNMVSTLNQNHYGLSQTATSQVNSMALSNAEKQIAEIKLKLALTEAERDELEFELMQSKSGECD